MVHNKNLDNLPYLTNGDFSMQTQVEDDWTCNKKDETLLKIARNIK